MEWQPIETAPKDGSIFMVWGYFSTLFGAAPDADNVAWGVGTLQWVDTAHERYEVVPDSDLYRKVRVDDGYFSHVDGPSGAVRATHWAPLPDGPRVMPTGAGLLGRLAPLPLLREDL